jgi:photosystem II stability/assembly factor-like uncharacterized protein
MKKQFFLLIGLAGFISTAYPQWQQTSLNTGLVSSLTINGTNVFAGINHSGVYLSTDEGNTWAPKNNGLPTSTFPWTLAASGSKIFAANDSGGVYLSTNNGTSWSAKNNGLTNKNVISLIVNGTDLYAGTSINGWNPNNKGVYRSTNDGGNWTAVNSGLPNQADVAAMAACGTTIFAGTDYGAGMFISNNNGGSWTAANSGFPVEPIILSMAVSGADVYAGLSHQGVYLSVNNGSSWTQKSSGFPAGIRIYSLAVSGSVIFAGSSENGVYYSTNSGNNWTEINTGAPVNAAVFSLAADENMLYAGFNETGVWKRPIANIIGVEEIKGTNTVSVVPNPATTKIHIKNIDPGKNSILSIYNLQGQMLMQQAITAGSETDVSTLPNGIYITRIVNSDKSYISRFIKQ